MSRVYWTARSVIEGRLFFADGGSRKAPRGFVWSSLRPRPLTAIDLRTMRWTVNPSSCGCCHRKVTGTRVLSCSDHFLDGLRARVHAD